MGALKHNKGKKPIVNFQCSKQLLIAIDKIAEFNKESRSNTIRNLIQRNIIKEFEYIENLKKIVKTNLK